MPILNIRELGSIGVVSDIAPWDLPPAAFTDGINFRLVSGKVQTAGGIEAVSAIAGRDIGHITQSTDLLGNSSWLVCGEDAILLFNGTDFIRLSGSAAKAIRESVNVDYTKWTSANIGNVTFFNNPEFNPFYWVDNNDLEPGNLEYLPWHIGETTETWQDAGMSCNIIRAHRNFLFALGMGTPDGQFNDMLHWSHPAEPNGIPFSWRPTFEEPSSIAGYVSLGRGGAIVGGESLRDSFVVYSEGAINILDFVGDALGWRRRAVSETAGLTNPNSLVEVKGSHMFFTGDDVLTFDGNSMQSIMHNRLRKRLAANINNDRLNGTWAAHYQTHAEVWFGVPEDGADFPSVAYCFNYRDNTWSIRDLEKQVVHARAGREPKSAYLTWDKSVTTWDDEGGSWTQAGDRPFREVMFGLASEVVHDLDPTISTAGGGTVDYGGQSWDGVGARASEQLEPWDESQGQWDADSRNWSDEPYVEPPEPSENPWDAMQGSWDDYSPMASYERSDTWLLRTDLPIGGHEINTTITRVYPYVEGTSKLEFRFGSQQHAGGPVAWAGGFREFTPGVDRKIDIRTTGELHAYEVRSKDGSFRLTGMDIEFSEAGAR
jgi:hypothetical protein